MDSKQLTRSRKNRIFFGVAGGIGEYFNVDPTIVRLVFVILTIWGGVGIILYIIGIFLIPEEKGSTNKNSNAKIDKEEIKKNFESVASEIREKVSNRENTLRGDQVFGLIILLLGLIFLFNIIFPIFNFWRLWPLILVVIGIVFLKGSKKGREK